jgi:hypothetical protein
MSAKLIDGRKSLHKTSHSRENLDDHGDDIFFPRDVEEPSWLRIRGSGFRIYGCGIGIYGSGL